MSNYLSPTVAQQSTSSSLDDVMNKQIFLQCIQYFTTKGIFKLVLRVKEIFRHSPINVEDRRFGEGRVCSLEFEGRNKKV